MTKWVRCSHRKLWVAGEVFSILSTIVFLSKRKEKDGTDVIGNIIHCRLNKSRLTKENSLVDVSLRYKGGLNRYYGLIELAEEAGIFKKVATRIEVADGSKRYGKRLCILLNNISQTK